jgi:hypothetical protein
LLQAPLYVQACAELETNCSITYVSSSVFCGSEALRKTQNSAVTHFNNLIENFHAQTKRGENLTTASLRHKYQNFNQPAKGLTKSAQVDVPWFILPHLRLTASLGAITDYNTGLRLP